MAAEVDRRLAREQPAPVLAPIQRIPEAPALAGSIPLPFYSTLHDPAGVTGARHREMRAFRPRVLECVACEYRKLENRLGDPAAHGLDRARLTREQLQHFGPGERNYTLCHTCHDTSGKIHPLVYEAWARERDREATQRTFRHDPAFAEIADRVAAVDDWRRGLPGDVDLAAGLANAREHDPVGPTAERDDHERDDHEFDGLPLDERVPTLADYKGQKAAEGRGRFGKPDPEFAAGAPYDAALVGADEADAWLQHEAWESKRKENFRRAWDRTEDIDDLGVRRKVRAGLVERWDPRMALSGDNQMVVANPFAEQRFRVTPYARSATHSGVDEGFASEPEWKRAALARHEAAVSAFVSEVRGKLAKQGVVQAEIDALTALPDLNPGREIGKFVHESPLRERIADESRRGPLFLAPAEELDAVARAAAARESVRDDVNHIGVLEAKRGRVDAESFVGLAERVRQRDTFQAAARAADEGREHVQKWAGALRQADFQVQGATTGFAREIREAFRDPQAFQRAFTQLTNEQKRSALQTLRERPADFAREFASAYGHDFGRAGELAMGRRDGTGPIDELQRSGILTANAGMQYLDAVRAREITRRHATRNLDLPPAATLKEVRDTCASRMAVLAEQKEQAIRGRDALGHVPTPQELERAFVGLHQADRHAVMKQVPGIQAMMSDRRRELSRSGFSL
jgi:hypothetical protein